jgi:O-succinylbenzoate synthase
MPAARNSGYAFECRSYRRKFRRPQITAHGRWTHREGLLVRLTDASGRTGYGEAAPVPGFTKETVALDLAIARRLGKTVTRAALARLPARCAGLRWALACARAMLEGELAFASRSAPLPVAALLPAGLAALAELRRRAGEGYRVFKWKIAAAPFAHSAGQQRALLPRLLATLPAGGQLRLDANGGLDAAGFAAWQACFHALGDTEAAIEFIEQPFPPDKIGAFGASWRPAARRGAVPVALDESVAGLPALRHAHTAGWRGPLVVKPSLLGDWNGFLRWRRRARADLVYSSAFETSVGLHAALWLAATDPHAGRRALGFGTLDAFPNDGLQLPVHAPGPALSPTPLSSDAFLALWNRLPPI